MPRTKIVIADRNWMIRDCLLRIIERSPEKYIAVGTAGNGPELLEIIRNTMPDLVLLDFTLPIIDGVEMLRIFAKDHQGLKAVILSDNNSGYNLCEVIAAGGAGFIQRNSSEHEITKAIDNVARFKVSFADDRSKRILAAINQKQQMIYLIGGVEFDERDIEVLKELCKSKTPEEIADQLNMSTHWVHKAKISLKEKTQTETTIGLVLFALENNIIRLKDI